MDHGKKERKIHDVALEKLQRARDEWNDDLTKILDFINKRVSEKNEARAYINYVDEAMLEFYRVFAKQTKSFPPEPQLSDFFQKIGQLLLDTVGTDLATYALYKYLK